MKTKHKTPEQKTEILSQIDALRSATPPLSLAAASRQVGISEGTYMNWRRALQNKKQQQQPIPTQKVALRRCVVIVTSTAELPAVLKDVGL